MLPAAAGARASTGQLEISYVGSTSFKLTVDGSAVAAGGTVPADSYEVLVDDADDTNPHFQLSGPGVSIDSNLNSTGMGIDRPATFGPFTFQANGSYTAKDVNAGISISFTVGAAASGGSSGGSSSGSSGATTTTTTSSGGSSSMGGSSTKTAVAGTLAGSISATSKAALTFHGKTVKRLKAGIYTLKVADHSKKAGLIVQKLGFPAMSESSRAFVGSHTSRLTLSTGRWFFKASSGGPKIYFTVTS